MGSIWVIQQYLEIPQSFFAQKSRRPLFIYTSVLICSSMDLNPHHSGDITRKTPFFSETYWTQSVGYSRL
jgi:hypothetical protein